MVIWKYKLEIVDLQAINMPVGASVLSVHRQGPDLCMWAMVDTSEPMQGRQFEVIGTGNPINPAQRLFVGTVVVGSLVWHVFERLS